MRLHLELARRRRRETPLSDALAEATAATAPDPAAVAESRSELEAVSAQLQRLPEIDRAALLLRAVDDLPYDEIARALGISLAAAKVKVHRARLTLADVRDRPTRSGQ